MSSFERSALDAVKKVTGGVAGGLVVAIAQDGYGIYDAGLVMFVLVMAVIIFHTLNWLTTVDPYS